MEWQKACWSAGLAGVLNADEQGLGKTLQTIAFLRAVQDHQAVARTGPSYPILVVAPTSLLPTWDSPSRPYGPWPTRNLTWRACRRVWFKRPARGAARKAGMPSRRRWRRRSPVTENRHRCSIRMDRWLTSDRVWRPLLVRRVELAPRVAFPVNEQRLDPNYAFPQGADLLPDADLLRTHRGKFGVHLLT